MSTTPAEALWERWRPRLETLCEGIQADTRLALAKAVREGTQDRLTRPVGMGAGDVTFGLDEPSEARIDRWAREIAHEEPLSVLTEDAGWRHFGPGAEEGATLESFDHGGPRIAFDPVDGTRNLMTDLRSAWTVVSFAPPGPDVPRQRDVCAGMLAEIATSRAAVRRVFWASPGTGCRFELRRLTDGEALDRGRVEVDADDRVDHGYFPFFRYRPEQRPALAGLERAFFERLAKEEGADLRSIYEDQYTSSGGQLALLQTGAYRSIVDARAWLAAEQGTTTVTAKPYDVSGAIVCARAAGAEVVTVEGRELDFPIDTTTPISFAGYANAATRRRLEPHWLKVIEDFRQTSS